MNTQKSYGKTRVCLNALSDPTSTNLSTVRNSEYIYYNIFWAFLHGQDVEILHYCVFSMIYAIHKRVFSLRLVENTLAEVFL